MNSFDCPDFKPGRTLPWVTSGFDIGPLVLAALGICISANMILIKYKLIKEKTTEHGLEYVILNDDESELWEIDYDSEHAANVSDYVKLDSLKHDNIVKYSGTIEGFLSEQRRCKNIHFHETMDIQPRLHMKSCSFETPS
ncbi:MAG: hypothetical protein ACJ71P_00330 [Nitrososphaeraceae archaeon]|jgi:hypothetical protein